MDLIHRLPTWLFAVLTQLVFVGAAVGGLAITRHMSVRRGFHALVDNGAVGWMFSAVLTIYAIAIGLIAVATWGNAAQASGVASLEAAQIAALYRDLNGYPPPMRSALRERLAAYTRFIIDEAWPAQRRGEIPRHGTEILNDFERALSAFEPATEGQRIAHADALESFDGLVERRRQRLEAVGYAVPARLWAVVLVGAALSLAASWVFALESFGLHALMTGILASIIALLVFFIATTDSPYRGDVGVPPTAYELVFHDLMESGAPGGPGAR